MGLPTPTRTPIAPGLTIGSPSVSLGRVYVNGMAHVNSAESVRA